MYVIIIFIIILSLSQRIIVNGVEEIGGLSIVRAPSSRTPSDPHIQSSQPSQPIPIPNSAAQTPTKKFRASPPPSTVAKPPSKGKTKAKNKKEPNVLPTTHEEQDQDQDPELDEDVRMMQSEAHSLRARASPNPNPAFNFNFSAPGPSSKTCTNPSSKPPSPSSTKPPSKSKSKSKPQLKTPIDSLMELSQGDTPQMERNKRMREGALGGSRSPSRPRSDGEDNTGSGSGSKGNVGMGKASKHTRRRSLISNRGKRVSSLRGVLFVSFAFSLLSFVYFLVESVSTYAPSTQSCS